MDVNDIGRYITIPQDERVMDAVLEFINKKRLNVILEESEINTQGDKVTVKLVFDW